jgi:hypothetical protein
MPTTGWENERQMAGCRLSLIGDKPRQTQGDARRQKMSLQSLNANRRDRFQPQLPYPNNVLRNDLMRVHEVWRESRRQHDRYSVYKYLTAVFDLVAVWQKED